MSNFCYVLLYFGPKMDLKQIKTEVYLCWLNNHAIKETKSVKQPLVSSIM